MKKLRKLICRIFGHAFTWSSHIDRDGYVCPRCGCRVLSASGREAKRSLAAQEHFAQAERNRPYKSEGDQR